MRFGTDLAGDERLASRWGTFFIRFVWPIFGLGSIPGFLLSLLWWRPVGAELVVLVPAVFVAMPAYCWLVSRPLRWVWAGPEDLRVSDGREDVRVPYSAIEDVRLVLGLVRVVLKAPTVVGARFVFIPRSRVRMRRTVALLRERAGLPVR